MKTIMKTVINKKWNADQSKQTRVDNYNQTLVLVQSKYEHKLCNDVRILQQRLAEEHTPESHGFT